MVGHQALSLGSALSRCSANAQRHNYEPDLLLGHSSLQPLSINPVPPTVPELCASEVSNPLLKISLKKKARRGGEVRGRSGEEGERRKEFLSPEARPPILLVAKDSPAHGLSCCKALGSSRVGNQEGALTFLLGSQECLRWVQAVPDRLGRHVTGGEGTGGWSAPAKGQMERGDQSSVGCVVGPESSPMILAWRTYPSASITMPVKWASGGSHV